MSTTYLGTRVDAKAFLKWAKKREIFLHPDVAFAVPTKTMGLGVFVAKPLKKGSVVVSCPVSSAISPYDKTSVESPCVAAIQQLSATHKISNTMKICLRLMAELAKGNSPLRPWLECCPRMDVHLFDLDADTQTKLWKGDGAQDDCSSSWCNVGQQMADLKLDEEWTTLEKAMAERPEIWPPAIATKGLFFECMAQILSRNFHREEIQGQEGPYLLPGIDFINHSFSKANCVFSMHGGGRHRALTFDVVAARDLAKGEQVFVNYGCMIEARFLIEFQFLNTFESNPHNALRFSQDTLTSMCVCLSSRQKESVQRRIRTLHDYTLLSDEGIFVPVEPEDSEEDDEHEQPRESTNSHLPAVRGVSGELWNVVYLLSYLDDHSFDDTKSKLSRHWECPKPKPVVDLMLRWLMLRMEGCRKNIAAAEEILRVQADNTNKGSSSGETATATINTKDDVVTSSATAATTTAPSASTASSSTAAVSLLRPGNVAAIQMLVQLEKAEESMLQSLCNSLTK